MDEKLNLAQVTALVVDSDQYSITILEQILRGFGLAKHAIVEDGEHAKRILQNDRHDLMICEAVLPDMPASDLVRWTRQLPDPQAKRISIIVMTGETHMSNVKSVRDSGANSIIRKPVAPNVLHDHIMRSVHSERPFIETDTYIGPCRRFKNLGPPGGVGRRKTDLSLQVGAASQPNMSQEEIDALLKPTKLAIE